MQAAQAEEMGLPTPPGLLSGIMSLMPSSVSQVTNIPGELSNVANQAQVAAGQAIGQGLNTGLGFLSNQSNTGLLDTTIGAGFNEIQEGLDNIGLGSSATPESIAADAVAEAGAVGGEPEIPAPTPEVPPSIANTATLATIPEVPGIDLTRLPLNPPIQFSPFPPTTGIV
jgi:hypothetical protein